MLTAIGDVMRHMYQRGWITTRDGNCSLRKTDSDKLYITPSGWRKTILHPEHIQKLRFKEGGGVEIPEGTKPSGELHMHYLILRNAKKTRAVVHAHPTHVVAALYRGYDLRDIATEFPEIFRYTRVGSSIEAIPAITAELGEATANALVDEQGKTIADIVGQANHGVCAVAGDPWSAYEHIERLNHVCEIVLASGVSPEAVADRAAAQRMHA